MSDAFLHERLFRNEEVMKKISSIKIAICGGGALGANIAESLARAGFRQLSIIDRDRVEEQNLSTQPYYRTDIGAFKAKIIGNTLYRALGVVAQTHAQELKQNNCDKLLHGADLIVDCFDN